MDADTSLRRGDSGDGEVVCGESGVGGEASDEKLATRSEKRVASGDGETGRRVFLEFNEDVIDGMPVDMGHSFFLNNDPVGFM